mmetsp:Transcript_1397/g.3036  ORF Transcript_1397/g.3036 Transcript_1397/m.3036 type:complete len:145 (+) Transcript_1397:424-858(+)
MWQCGLVDEDSAAAIRSYVEGIRAKKRQNNEYDDDELEEARLKALFPNCPLNMKDCDIFARAFEEACCPEWSNHFLYQYSSPLKTTNAGRGYAWAQPAAVRRAFCIRVHPEYEERYHVYDNEPPGWDFQYICVAMVVEERAAEG